jgi:hypothetical protein
MNAVEIDQAVCELVHQPPERAEFPFEFVFQREKDWLAIVSGGGNR